jgi:hypothetical protein
VVQHERGVVKCTGRGQGGVDLCVLGRLDRLDAGHGERPFGDRAGLVGAQHIDAGEHFDRRQLLHQAALAGEAHHAHCEGDTGEQHEALWHHAHQAGDGADDRFPPALVAPEELAAREQQTDRDDEIADPGDDAVDVVAQGRVDEGEAAGFLGQLGRVVLRAHLGDHHPPGAGHHGAAAQHLVVRGLHHRVGLAGEQRLVDLQVLAGQHDTVGDHLRATAQLHHVIEHQLVHLQLADGAVAHRVGTRGVDNTELVEHGLGPQLLHHTDDAVGDDHPAEQGILR